MSIDQGIKLLDTEGKYIKLTPDIGTIVAAGRITMPNSLNADNTYGVDIELPGKTIDQSKIAVLVVPGPPVIKSIYAQYADGATLYYNTFYADSTAQYYSRNQDTGVMTSWAAGNRTDNSKATWNPILSACPIAFWDKRGSSVFNKIRLFAATAYMVRDTHADTNYSLTGTASGSGGLEDVNNIKDDNLATYYGNYFYVPPTDPSETMGSMGIDANISFTAKSITHVEINHAGSLSCSGGSAGGTVTVYLYYNSAWNSIFVLTWGNYQSFNQTDTIWGLWPTCTGVRVVGTCYGRKTSGYSDAFGDYACKELRAFGETVTDNDNLLRYTIGNIGVPYVDYVISMKNWDF